MKTNKKAELKFEMVPTLVVTLVVIALVLGIAGTVLRSVGNSQCTAGYLTTGGTCANCLGNNVWNESAQLCSASGGGANTSALYYAQSHAFNATFNGASGINTLGTWQPTWAVIIAAAVVIGIIGAYLMFRRD